MSERIRFWLVSGVSLAFSIGGILVCIFVVQAAPDAGRGGAIGVAIALGFLFISRDYGFKLYTTLTHDLPDLLERAKKIKQGEANSKALAAPTVVDLEKRIALLASAIAIEGQAHRTESVFLAFATFVGTIVWGFGDMAAQYFIQHFLFP